MKPWPVIIIHSTIINFFQLDEINLMKFLEQIKEIVLKFQFHPPSLKYKKLLPPSYYQLIQESRNLNQINPYINFV